MCQGCEQSLSLWNLCRMFCFFLAVSRLHMKPDCQQVLTQFASFSVEELSDSEAANFLHHVEECEPCKGQWLLFEKTLTVVTQSGPHDEDVEQFRSQQMWLVCMEHAHKNQQKSCSKAKLTSGKRIAVTASPEQHLASSSNSGNAGEGSETKKSGGVLVEPRVGLMLIGGALLFLASSYWFAPTPATAPATALPPMPAQLQTVGFDGVPRAVAPLVDYGATLGVDVLSDRVSPALIAAPTKNLTTLRKFEVPRN